MEFVPVLALLLLVKKVIDFLKYATNKDRNGMITIGVAWFAGTLAVVLYAATDFAQGIDIGDKSLGDLNVASLIAIGLWIGSGAGVVADVISSRRPSDDPARLKLLPNSPTP